MEKGAFRMQKDHIFNDFDCDEYCEDGCENDEYNYYRNAGPAGANRTMGVLDSRGNAGLRGPQGPQGITGVTGATGPQGIKGDIGPTGATGLKGDTGATGTESYPFQKFCEQQILHVLKQMLKLHPEYIIKVVMEGGDAFTGLPISIWDATDELDMCMLQLANNNDKTITALSISKIASIQIINEKYDDAFTYLTNQIKATGKEDIRLYLPEGTPDVLIKTGGHIAAQGTIFRSEHGMIIIVGADNSYPTFVSLVKADVIIK